MMWTKGNYRRIFLDMHINDADPVYLSKIDPEHIVSVMKDTGAQMLVVKSRPHTGLALFPTKYGRMHRGLKGRDYVGEMIGLCHKNGIAVQCYFSQIFDNYAYDTHPEWRMVNGEGKGSREYEDYTNQSMYRRGRYGLVCPNHEEYRKYAVDCLTEMTEKYEFESIFMDMPFFPEVCYCPSCRKKYYEATGREMPKKIELSSKEFREWQLLREEWMGEFTKLTSQAVKAVRPEVTIEQNICMIVDPWQYCTTELVYENCDYAGGDLYGGFLEGSFISKFFRHISKTLPFEFITSRCEPTLSHHTTTRSKDELLLQTMVALAHDGAISVCDGMNPDGTIADKFYKNTMKAVFSEAAKYPEHIGGDLISDVAIWFPTRMKISMSEDGGPIVTDKMSKEHIDTKLHMAYILRQEHIPFDVIPSGQIADCASQVLIIDDIVNILDSEMDEIRQYVAKGGSLYISGHVGHPELLKMLEAHSLGLTEHNVTYMSPTKAGETVFDGFDASAPLNIQNRMELLEFSGEYETLATLTLPYTMTGKTEFASIHSNPPGIPTVQPVVVLKKTGASKLLWTGSPIENQSPYLSKKVVGHLVQLLISKPSIHVEAPACVEVIRWAQGDNELLTVFNEQEKYPFIPVAEAAVTLPREVRRAVNLANGEELPVEKREDGSSVIKLSGLDIFQFVKVE
ncbi:MAG: alpha-L-fucosidase [Blautia sp.]|nr:alpha-L-fucosidase [Blautia sp.]